MTNYSESGKSKSMPKAVVTKRGEVSLYEYETYQDVVTGLPYFLEEVYNQKRLHSVLSYRPPNEFEEALANREIAKCPARLS